MYGISQFPHPPGTQVASRRLLHICPNRACCSGLCTTTLSYFRSLPFRPAGHATLATSSKPSRNTPLGPFATSLPTTACWIPGQTVCSVCKSPPQTLWLRACPDLGVAPRASTPQQPISVSRWHHILQPQEGTYGCCGGAGTFLPPFRPTWRKRRQVSSRTGCLWSTPSEGDPHSSSSTLAHYGCFPSLGHTDFRAYRLSVAWPL